MTTNKYRKWSKEEIAELPFMSFEGKIHLIETRKMAIEALSKLSTEDIVGFDTECRPAFRKGESYDISLLQLSTYEDAYLFRLNKFDIPSEMTSFFEDESILKPGVAIRDDIKGLKKLKPFEDKGFVELQTMAKERGIENFGLRGLAAVLFGKKLSKRARVSNWEQPKLTASQLKYAATDAWMGIKIYNEFIK